MPASPGRPRPYASRFVRLAAAVLVTALAPASADEGALARGDAAWQRRAEGRQGLRAAAGPIGEAVAAYRQALAGAPGSIAVRQRLLRALYFQGRFAADGIEAQREIYARGRDVAEEGITLLAADLGVPLDPGRPAEVATAVDGRPEAAGLFFWAAAHWGLWGETGGAFAAARSGVAGKVRQRAETAIAIDESFLDAGGLRLRGRLHTEAPRIPLVTGWVDRELAVTSLERAVELAPQEPQNRLYLAEALLRFRPDRRDEALALLRQLSVEAPRPGDLLEDSSILAAARRLLAKP